MAEVVTGRGSRFLRCRRSEADARFTKYPHQPVLSCPGFEEPPVIPFPETP